MNKAKEIKNRFDTIDGTTLYLCLEDSRLRIQNRLFEIMEDAPPSVHFCTDVFIIGGGLEERIESFIAEHPDTTLIIIDTLQMVRGTGFDNICAEYNRILTWADMYEGSSIEARKMILRQIIKKVYIGRHYEVRLELAISFAEYQRLYLGEKTA